jgi:type III secretion protein W
MSHDVDDVDARAWELMRQVVSLCSESWITRDRFLQMAAQWTPDSLPERIRFLTELKRVFRELPVQIFPDLDARQALLTALQDGLDELVSQEEAQEG